jgi:hypothetical protein
MSTILYIIYMTHQEWEHGSRRIGSLLDLLEFNAAVFIRVCESLAAISAKERLGLWNMIERRFMTADPLTQEKLAPQVDEARESNRTVRQDAVSAVSALRPLCEALQLPLSVMQIDRIVKRGSDSEDLVRSLDELRNRIRDELDTVLFLELDQRHRNYYEDPLSRWSEVIERFPGISFDVEEAGKTRAMERYTSCVFHLMRVAEAGVIELQCFWGSRTIRRTSVLSCQNLSIFSRKQTSKISIRV